MHDHRVGLGPCEPFFVQPEHRRVLADTRKHCLALALVLNAQQIDHVGITNRLLDVVRDAAAEFFKHPRHERRRTRQRDVRAEFREQPDVRPRHARIQNVAEDRDVQSRDAPLLFADRERIEQRLRRMLVRAVARVDHARLQQSRQKMRRARRRVTDHDDVRVQRLQVQRGVLQRLALDEARRRRRDVDDVRRQSFRRELKTCPRPRRGFDEQIHHRLAAQRRHLFYRALTNLLERRGGIEQIIDFVGRQLLNAEQIFVCPRGRFIARSPPHLCHRFPLDGPAPFARAVGTFLPM